MKKITLVALFCALFMAPSLKAQEVTYVEDPAQGYLFNKFKDNWFIMAEGGAGVAMTPYDSHMDFKDRIGYSFQLSFGKWFSPIIGIRLGGDAYQVKGLLESSRSACAIGTRYDEPMEDGHYKQRSWQFGPTGDVLVNLTNWWCGYRPGRVYNAIFYAGAACNIAVDRAPEAYNSQALKDWAYAGSNNFSLRGGLLNTFAVSKHVDLLLDLRADFVQEHFDGFDSKHRNAFGTVLVGFSYKFNRTDWGAPIVPVCPQYKYTDAEGDALASRLQAADAKIASLEQQLRDCLNKKPEEVKADAPLATVYFPINSSKVTPVQSKVVSAVANVMKDTNNNYVLTGWADNYTGNDKINKALRAKRAQSVKTLLVKKGVDASKLDTQVNDNNLTNFGAKSAALDRAVTINEAK